MNLSLLEEIGLTKSEINVYLALLELGSSSTGKIVEKSKASSSKIYEILDRLMEKGLVSYIVESGVKQFEAAPPDRLLDFMKEKKDKIQEQNEQLKKILPQLKLKAKEAEHKTEATIYKGIKGLETGFWHALDKLKPGDETQVLGIAVRDDAQSRFFARYEKERARRKIKSRMLFNETAKQNPISDPENTPRAKVKFTNDETPASIDILGNQVLIAPTSEIPLLIYIDNKMIADSFRVQFENRWQQDVKVYKGFEDVTNKFRSMLDEMKPHEEYLVLGATYGTVGKLKKWFFKYHTERVKLKRKVRLLSVPRDYELIVKELSETGDPEMKLGAAKKLPGVFSSPMQINLYKNNKVLMFLWDEMTCIEVESKTLYTNFKTYFDALWDQDTSMDKGIDALNTALNGYLDSLEPNESFNVQGATFGKGDSSYSQKQYFDAFKNIHQKRADRKIKARLLFQQRDEATIEKFRKTVYNKYHEAKVLPYKTEFPVAILPSRNKTVIIIHKDEPSIITINNKEASLAFLKHFDSLWSQDTTLTKGFDNLYTTFRNIIDSLKPGEEFIVLGAAYGTEASRDEYQNCFKAIHTYRKKKGVKARLLFYPDTKRWVDKNKQFYRDAECKFLPYAVSSPVATIIYKDKTILIIQEETPTIIEIDNKNISLTYKAHFESIWNSIK